MCFRFFGGGGIRSKVYLGGGELNTWSETEIFTNYSSPDLRFHDPHLKLGPIFLQPSPPFLTPPCSS